MRILFCNYEYPPLGGGGGVMNELLAQELAKRHEVTVLTSRAFHLPATSYEGGVRIIRAPVLFRTQEAVANFASMFAFMLSGTRVGKSHLKKSRYDVINTHFVLPTGPVGDALSRYAKIPNVLTLHGGDLYDPTKRTSPHQHRFLRAWVRKLLNRANVIVGQSNNTIANMRTYYAPELQATRIPLGIGRPLEGVAARERYGFSSTDVLLVSVGRLVARKGLDRLINIVANLEDPKVHLLIIGTGPLEQELKQKTKEHGLEGQVLFLGQVGELEKFKVLRMCDIYASTTQHEGFGLVFLEGMACGLPVLSYEHGGQTDFLEDGVTGYLTPLNSDQLFQQRCSELIKDRELRERMGRTNLDRIQEYFIDSCARRYEELFENVVAQTPSAEKVSV